jgi:glutathione S-transferase
MHILVALVTMLALLLYVVMLMRTGDARRRYKVEAPATTGNLDFERVFRIQANTLENLIVFLPALWIFTAYANNDPVAAGIGAVWVVGRILYMVGYGRAAQARGPGFAISGLATVALVLGGLGLVIWHGLHHGWMS